METARPLRELVHEFQRKPARVDVSEHCRQPVHGFSDDITVWIGELI
jgi:hypothetical protein